jgi:hypothetical protein
MWAMIGGAIPANRRKVKAAESVRGGARTRVFAETRRAARVRCLKPPDAPGGFLPYVMRDRDFIATSEFGRIQHGQLYNHSSRIQVC